MSTSNQEQTSLNISNYNNYDTSSSYYYEMSDETSYNRHNVNTNTTSHPTTLSSNNGKLIGAKSSRRCPICNGNSSCSFTEDYGLVLCHRESRAEVPNPTGGTWIFHNYSENGSNTTWAVYKLVSKQSTNFEEKTSWIKKITGYEKPPENKKAEGSTLSATERDLAYRKLANYLGFAKYYNSQLLGKRELLQSEIDFLVQKQLIFTWDNQADIGKLNLPSDLPGINTNLKGIKLCGSDGYFIPALDLNNNIVGGQIAARNRDNGKYKAVSSNGFGGKSWHIDGEWPLAYWDFINYLDLNNLSPNRKDLGNILFITEGFLKSLILGIKLNRCSKNYRIIGASGGQFYHSYKQLKAIMKHGNYSRIILCADKGSPDNKSVVENYQKLNKTLRNWGYKVDVIHFNMNDCDELQSFEYLDFISSVITWNEFERRFNPSFVEKTTQETLGKLEQRKKQYLEQKELKSVSIQTDTEYLDIPVPQEGDVFMIKSPLGTGKTTYLDKVLSIFKYGWLLIGYRNNLLIETCCDRSRNGTPFYHLHEDEMYNQMADFNANIAFCVDSLPNWTMQRLEGRPIIIDECKSVMHHILTSSTRVKDDRIFNLNKLKEAIRMSPMVILLDATCDEQTYKFYQELAGGRKVIVHENLATKKPCFNVVVTTGLNQHGESTRDKSHLIKQIAINNNNIAVFSDSRRECEAINQIEINRGRKTLLITSETVIEPEVKTALKNLTEYIKVNNIQTLIYSPSGESGINIDMPDYFSVVFGIFYGVISIDSCMQMLGRVRDTNAPRVITIPTTGIGENDNIFSLQIENKIVSNAILDAAYTYQDSEMKNAVQSILQGSINDSIHWSFKYIATIRADLNLERQFFKELFMQRLEQMGMNVYTGQDTIDREIKTMVKEHKEESKVAEAAAIFNAEDIDEEEFKALSAKYSLTLKQQRQLKKYSVKTRLPGIEKSDLWSIDLIKDLLIDHPQKITQLERLFEIELPQLSQEKSKVKWHQHLSKEHLSLTDIKTDLAVIKTLLTLNVPDLLEEGLVFRDGNKQLEQLHKKCSHKEVIKILGLRPGNQSPIRFFGLLIKKYFGLDLIKFRPSVNGKQIVEYMVERYDEQYLSVIFDCIVRRAEKIFQKASELSEPLAVKQFQLREENLSGLDKTDLVTNMIQN